MLTKLKLIVIRMAIGWLKEINDPDLKRAVLTEAVKHLYNAVGPDDILKQNSDGSWTFEGRPLLSTEVAKLMEEARQLRGMKLWRAIKLDVRYQLGKKMFEEAKVKDDILWGQLLTYLDDIIRTRIGKMK